MLPNWLPINVIAEEWSKETGQSPGLIERALVEWFSQCSYEIDPREEGDGWIDRDLDEWPPVEGISRETLMPNRYLRIYCRLQNELLPSFWFPEEGTPKPLPPRNRNPGRPSYRDEYQRLFYELLEAGEIDLNKSKKQAARQLHERFPKDLQETIARHIKDIFDQAALKTRING
jgi:hypothetical protein